MSTEVPLLMPKMSMTMESGELISWEVELGAQVRAGDVMAVVQTDKVDMEIEAPADGTVTRFDAEPGTVVDVGTPIAYITTETESLMAGLLDEPNPDPDSVAGFTTTDANRPASPGRSNNQSDRFAREPIVATPPSRLGPLPAVPRARRRAAQLGIQLADVAASGANGVITVDDVERAAGLEAKQPTDTTGAFDSEQAPTALPATVEIRERVTPPDIEADEGPTFAQALATRRRSVRAAVARTMTRSATVPQFTAFADLDLTVANHVREGVSWTVVLLRALALALKAHPEVLAGWDDNANAPAAVPDSCSVALAVDTPVGLLVPVVRDADRVPLAELQRSVRDLISRARKGKLTLSDTQGATTTLSSLGGLGVPMFTSLLTPPQSTALSVGTIEPKAVVHAGGLAVRLGVTVGLTVDHRAVDGADAAAILAELRTLLDNPKNLLR